MLLHNLPSATDPYGLITEALRSLAEDLGTRCITPPLTSLASYDRSKFFQVKDDCTIDTYEALAQSVEIATPILKNSSWTWVIPKMCQAINTATETAETQISFNDTTGLHVHIAPGRDYTLPELKRVSKAIIIFEKHMDKYHPKCRSPSTNSHINACRDSTPLINLSDTEALKAVDEARSLERIICTMNGWACFSGVYRPSRWFRYNFLSLKAYGTIEFRQAMGTISAEKVLNWIKTVIKFVTAAIKTPDHLFTYWALEGIPPVVYYVYGVPNPPGYKKWKFFDRLQRNREMDG